MPKSPTSKAPSKMKKKRVKTLSQKMKVFRSSDPLVTVLMWGVSHSINDLMHVPQRVMLMPDDFKAFIKLKVENQNFNKEHMPSNFKFKEYCPLVFKNLRERFGVTEQEYLDSIVRGEPIPKDIAGRSGSKFFLTIDKKFLIKSLTSEELEKMHHLLKRYHEHVVETRGRTLLPQYLALYRLTVNNAETYLVVMRNVFSQKLKVHYKYDLKGSTVGREATEKERNAELPTFKDNDFVEGGHKLFLGVEQKQQFMDIVRNDVQFLERNNLIDFSLLVGMHSVSEGGYASGVEEDEEQLAELSGDEDLSDVEQLVEINNNGRQITGELNDGQPAAAKASAPTLSPQASSAAPADASSPAKQHVSSARRAVQGRATSMIVGSRDAAELSSSILTNQQQQPPAAGRHGSGDAAAVPQASDQQQQHRVSGGNLTEQAAAATADPDRGLRVNRWASAPDAPVRFVYFLAIIDVLTHYGVRKATAQAAKTVKYGTGAEISTVRPEYYCKRFLDFLDQVVIV